MTESDSVRAAALDRSWLVVLCEPQTLPQTIPP